MGLTFYQTLLDLYERLGEYLSPRVDSAVALQSYLVIIGLVNVSNEPRAAAGLLAWSEDVRWNDGWRDAYVRRFSLSLAIHVSMIASVEGFSLVTLSWQRKNAN